MINELWEDVIGYNGYYQVSNLGNVKSKRFNKEKKLKPIKHGGGYLSVTLYNNGHRKVKLIHHLVAECFLNHFTNGLKVVIDHINDYASDNRVDNLQVVTQRYNVCKTQGRYLSNYKGVYKCKNKWKSQIVINKKTIYLGVFNTELEAHMAYKNKLNSIE
jgi:hypothetical protein